MNAVDRLAKLVPMPREPTAAGGEFAPIEAELGTALPADYKEIVHRYGYGTFCDFLHLWSPFFTECTMAGQARGALDADRELARSSPGAVPFASFPERDGALPWARSDNGDVVYWLTKGEPDAWPVALWNPRGGEGYGLVEGGAAAFLAEWIGGETRLMFFKKPSIACFDPWRARVHETLNLSPASAPFGARLDALLEAFAPTESRGGYGDEGADARQVHFVAHDGTVRVTYDTVYHHNVRLAAPAAEMDAARALVERAVAKMGCAVTKVTRG